MVETAALIRLLRYLLYTVHKITCMPPRRISGKINHEKLLNLQKFEVPIHASFTPLWSTKQPPALCEWTETQKMQRVSLHTSERTDGGTEQSWWKPEKRGEKAGGREVTIRHCSCAARWEICCHKLVWVGCCCRWRWIWCSLKKAVVDLRRPPPGHINKLWRYCWSQRSFKIINLVQEKHPEICCQIVSENIYNMIQMDYILIFCTN